MDGKGVGVLGEEGEKEREKKSRGIGEGVQMGAVT